MSRAHVQHTECVGGSLLVLLGGDGLVLALAGPPEQEGNAQGGESHHSEGSPVQLEKNNQTSESR
jgi:hypothetical protein